MNRHERIYNRLKAASGKLDLLLQHVRKLNRAIDTMNTAEEFREMTRDDVERIALLFTPKELNDLAWIKDVYNGD